MEHSTLLDKIKEEIVEIKQEEVSFELNETEAIYFVDGIKEESVVNDEINEEDVSCEIDGNGDANHNEMTEFISVKSEIVDDCIESSEHEPDPLALFPAVYIKGEPHFTEEEHTSTTDACPSTSQNTQFLTMKICNKFTTLDKHQKRTSCSSSSRKSFSHKMDERNKSTDELARKRELVNARMRKYRKRKHSISKQLDSLTQNEPVTDGMKNIKKQQTEEEKAQQRRELSRERSRRYRERKRNNALKIVDHLIHD